MSVGTSLDHGRRRFLTGRKVTDTPLRPPWSLAEDSFLEACTRCGDCLSACPEGILISGSGGYPEISFTTGECTFCRHCVEACEQSAFDTGGLPWSAKAQIDESCIARQQVLCQLCRECCEANAIRFPLTLGRVPTPVVVAEQCSGCGACVSACPVAAVRVVHQGDPSE
jgi:ferredoxin-type protein NapF